MKKRLLILFLCMLCTASLLLTACGGGDEEPDGTESAIPITLFNLSEGDYSIVYSADAPERLKDQVIALREAVKEATGEKPAVYTDDLNKTDEKAREILVGPTNRDESGEVADRIDTRGYRVEFVGEKLVIAGSNDDFIALAVEELLSTATTENQAMTVSPDLVLTHNGEGIVKLMNNDRGIFNYRVVISREFTPELMVAVNNFRDTMRDVVDIRPGFCYADEESKDAFEILVGDTGREESNKIYETLEYFDYRICFDGDRIVVAARSDTQIKRALDALLQEFRAMADSSYNGEYLLRSDLSKSAGLYDWTDEIPMIDELKTGGVYDASDGSFVINHKNAKETDYDGYLAKLREAGFAEVESYTLGENGENRYSLQKSDSASLYVSWLSQTKQIRIFAEKATASVYPTVTDAYEGGEETPTFWMLKSDYRGSGHNGGSSFVIRLTDGTYLIEDGGYNTDAEADQLYETLCKYTPEGEKPVVSMWFISHQHSDHFGCLKNFSSRYADKVDVKAFGYNFTKNGSALDGGSDLISSIENSMKQWPNAVRYNKLHSGMKLGFADATATVICTHEDVYPRDFYGLNDTCTVIRVDVGGQRIMLLADACLAESKTMSETIPVSELKSDMVQIAHHGYEGCLEDLYAKIDAKVGLWTMSIYGYKMDTVANVFENWMSKGDAGGYPYANRYLINESSIEKFFVDGAGTVELQLPYTVEGDRLPDYKAIFEEIKATAPRS